MDVEKKTGTTSRVRRSVWLLIGIAFMAGLGGMIFGYDQGSVGNAQGKLSPPSGFVGYFQLDTAEQAFVVSLVALFALVGAVITSPINDRIGRKRTSLAAAATSLVGGIIMALAVSSGMLMAGRAVLGLSVGMISTVVPNYLSEMSPARHRGKIVSAYQLAITAGIVVAAGIGLAEIHESRDGWRLVLGLIVVPTIIFGVAMAFMPDTPRWLLSKKRAKEAEEVLTKTEGPETAPDTTEAIKKELEITKDVSYFDIFHKALRPALLIGIFAAIFNQLSLINGSIYYGTTIINDLGFSSLESSALMSFLFIYVVNMFATVIALPIVDRFGRRPLLILGCAGIALSFVVCMIAAIEINAQEGHHETWSWVLVTAVSVSVAFTAMSTGPLGWVLIAEVFPTHVRAPAMSFCLSINWLFVFIVSMLTPVIINWLAPVYFGLGVVFMLITIIIALVWLPETKGVPLEQIQEVLNRKRPAPRLPGVRSET